MSNPRTVTLATSDHGPVTLTEPSWCAGHTGHDPDTLRIDLAHTGEDVVLRFRGQQLASACLDQAPFAERASREVQVSVTVPGQALDARGAYELAAAFDRFADELRGLADRLLVIRAEGDL